MINLARLCLADSRRDPGKRRSPHRSATFALTQGWHGLAGSSGLERTHGDYRLKEGGLDEITLLPCFILRHLPHNLAPPRPGRRERFAEAIFLGYKPKILGDLPEGWVGTRGTISSSIRYSRFLWLLGNREGLNSAERSGLSWR